MLQDLEVSLSSLKDIAQQAAQSAGLSVQEQQQQQQDKSALANKAQLQGK